MKFDTDIFHSKIGIAIAVCVVTILVIYLTPLKHLNLIDPNPVDIDPAEFAQEFEKNPDKFLFIDVREKSVYDRAHAKGAISQPIGSLYDLRHTLPKTDKEIVIICTSGRLAGVAYGFLQNWGHLNLLRIEGGMQKWALEGLPLEGSDILAPLPEYD